MDKVHAPFNFVPLSREVFYPDWSDKISQDIPFKDGVSGWIDLAITAQTPIFVRDGHTKEEGAKQKQNGEYETAARLPDGRFYLPATSVKGCVRNVLEILGNCKMKVDKNAKFAKSDWSDKLKLTKKGVQGGWLRRRKGTNDYEIVPAKAIYRIGMHAIDAFVEKKVMEEAFYKKEVTDDQKNAAYKYKLLRNEDITLSDLENLFFEKDEPFLTEKSNNRVRVSPKGLINGTIVLTGQPNKVECWAKERAGCTKAGKYYEFVFEDYQNGEAPESYNLSEEDFKHYEFIYQDSEDWKFAKKRLEDRKGIPVFFLADDSNLELKSFGLAYLYKVPYDFTPAELEEKRHDDSSEKPDLSECIFGYTSDSKKSAQSLKGRVQFSNFVSKNAEEEMITDQENFIRILNGPKASYYPIYIHQDQQNGYVSRDYKTYNDGQLSGWKRYHIRKNVWKKFTGDDKLDTKFKPLKAGTTFTGRVRFHNLLPQELGALLSAIKFHNTEGCCHQIGKAKPYGFGVVEINVDEIDLNGEKLRMDDEPINRCMIAFEDLVYSAEWKNIADELVTLASTLVEDTEQYKYMNLSMDGTNDFSDAKKEKAALRPFSSIVRRKTVNDSYRKIKEELKRKAEEEQKRKEAEEKAKRDELVRQEAERQKAEAERQKAERLSKGLVFLSEKYDDGPNAGNFKVNDFKGIRNRVDRYLKQSGLASISEEDIPLLNEALERVQTEGKKATKGWDEKWIKKVKG